MHKEDCLVELRQMTHLKPFVGGVLPSWGLPWVLVQLQSHSSDGWLMVAKQQRFAS